MRSAMMLSAPAPDRASYIKTKRRIESIVFTKIDPVDEHAREAVRATDSQVDDLATPTGGNRNFSAVPGGSGILMPAVFRQRLP